MNDGASCSGAFELRVSRLIGLKAEEVADEPHILANVLSDGQSGRRIINDKVQESPARFVGRPPHLIERHRFVLLVRILEREFDIEFHHLPQVQIDLEDLPRLAKVSRVGENWL